MKNNFKYLILFAFLFGVQSVVTSQELSEVKAKFKNYQSKPNKKASKNIYINSFNVLVEVYREDVDYKAKREFRGKGRAEALARAALGLKGVDTSLLQQKTDLLFAEFIQSLESKGFAIIDASQASNTDYYKNAKSFKGPMVRESANPGLLEVLPAGFSGFTSKANAAGKSSKKEGLMPGLKGLGKLVKNTNMLSKELDDAIVIDVNLTLSWSESGGSWLAGLGSADAKIKTNLALGEKAVSAPNENGKSKGKEDYYILPNDFSVAQGSGLRKVDCKGYLKNPIYINGVISNTVVQSNNKGNASKTYDIGDLYRVTEWTSSISENAKFIEVDPNKFSDALYLSGKAFINAQLDYFFDLYK